MNTESHNSLEEGTAIIVPENGLNEKLELAQQAQRPLVIKLGFDPTAPDLHLGHAVVLKKLRQFQDAGHQVVVIIGDFTAQIGDPTGKNKARPPLEKQQVEENAKTYLTQLSKILDISKIQIKFNSEWFDQMHLVDMIKLISQLTLAQILERNDFRQRYDSRSPIALHEMMYPVLQGYDSLMIDADVEIGGTDQLFNIMIGRNIQETRRRIGQIAVCMPLLRGRDGTEKMSKSQGNHIGLLESPTDMYGKIMSIPDALLIEYLDLTTSFTTEEKERLKQSLQGGANPMTIKKAIAFNVVEQYHNHEASEEAERFFITQVQSRGLDSKEFQVISLDSLNIGSQNVSLIDLCHALEPDRSKSRIRDMIKSGAISVNGDKIVDERHILSTPQNGTRIKIGKRGYYEVLVK